MENTGGRYFFTNHNLRSNKMERKYSIGVDPSFINMGVSIYHLEKKKILLQKTGDFNTMVNWIGRSVDLRECYGIVENPDKDSNIFGMFAMVKDEIEQVMRYQLWRAVKMGLPSKWVSRILTSVKVSKKNASVSSVEKSLFDVQKKFGIAMKIASSVGENRAAAKLIIKMLSEHKVPIVEIAPSKRDRVDRVREKLKKKHGKFAADGLDIKSLTMPTKSTAEDFRFLTGYTERTNEHNRDAGTLVWGKNANWIEMKLKEQGYYETLKTPSSYPKQTNYNEYVLDRKKISL